MDGQLKPSAPHEGRDIVRGGMPFERPSEMPVQDLRNASPPTQPMASVSIRTVIARAIACLGALAFTGYGVYEMLGIVSFSNMTVLQGVMIVFFAVTLAWISFAASSSIAGLFVPPPRPSGEGSIAGSLTALVMPIYNEDPARTTSAMRALAEALGDAGAAQQFEIVVISDSTNADAWIAESLAVDQLDRKSVV